MMHVPYYFDDTIMWGAWHRWWYAPFFCIAVVLVVSGFITYRRRLALLAHVRNALLVLPGYAVWKGVCKMVLQVVAITSLFIALLQPQWGRKQVSLQQEGRDVIIALDISRSMQAQDVKPSRLAVVKIKIRKLLEKLSFERVGLILFSGGAFVQCPLTADYKTFLMFLDHVTTEAISSGTTAIGTAIEQAAEVFNRSKNRKSKLVLLVTDGEDFASDIDAVARTIADEKMTIISWGVGTQKGAPVPLYDAYGKPMGHAKTKDGNVATSALNEPLLQKISRAVGGHYQRVSQDDGDISAIVAQLDATERESFEEQKMTQYHDRYPYFLCITLLCLVLEWLL